MGFRGSPNTLANAASIGGGPTIGTGGSLARFAIVEQTLYAVDDFNLNVFGLEDPSSPDMKDTQNVSWFLVSKNRPTQSNADRSCSVKFNPIINGLREILFSSSKRDAAQGSPSQFSFPSVIKMIALVAILSSGKSFAAKYME